MVTRGFTLIESAIVVAIISILSVAAAPSFRDFVTTQRIKTTAFDLFADMAFARSEAIKTNSEVVIAKAATGWSAGWVVTWVDRTGATQTLRTRTAPAGLLALSGSVDHFNFQRNGRPPAGSPAAKFTVDGTIVRQGIVARCIQVDPSGRPMSLGGACS